MSSPFDSLGDEIPEIHSEVLEFAADPQQIRNRAREDINFFAGMCLPEVMIFLFPPYYVALFQFLVQAITHANTERDRQRALEKVIRIAIGLPRGFAKTTFLKVLMCWLIVHDKVSFLLVVCAAEDLAENFIGDLSSILSSPNLERVYGKWNIQLTVDNKGLKKALYRGRIVIIRGIGSLTAIRGIVIDNKRPDFILCDDMQTKENAESDTEAPRTFSWFIGTLLKTISPFHAIICYVGNMYKGFCILEKLKENPAWVSLVTGAILDSGEALWPELHSINDLYLSFKHDESLGMADIWFAEIMNDPVPSESALLHGPLPLAHFDYSPIVQAAFVTVDPAGFRKGSDDNVITGHQIIEARPHIAEMDGGKWDPGATVKNSLMMAVRLEAALIGVEGVAYQETLKYWFDVYIEKNNLTGIQVVIVKTGRSSKETRIRSFIKEMYSGEYPFMRDIDRLKFSWQATAYRTGKKNNRDDWLDSPAMGPLVRNQFPHLMTVRKGDGNPKAGVVTNNTPF